MNVDRLMSVVNDEFMHSPGGMQCTFIKLNDYWGIKIYFDEHKRDECYDMQAKCAEHELAPKVGKTFELPRGLYRFGYFTEIAQMLFDDDSPEYELNQWEEENWEKIQNMTNLIYAKTGWEMIDNHALNIGFVRGRMVPIDFGINDGSGGFENRPSNDFSDIEQAMLDNCS